MLVPQVVVVALLLSWHCPWHALGVAALAGVQALMMRRFVAAPLQRATWYSANGVTLYVIGMLVSAFALRSAGAA